MAKSEKPPSARYIVAVFALAVGIMGVLLYAVGLI